MYGKLTPAQRDEIITRSKEIRYLTTTDVCHAASIIASGLLRSGKWGNSRGARADGDAYAAVLTVLIHKGFATVSWAKGN